VYIIYTVKQKCPQDTNSKLVSSGYHKNWCSYKHVGVQTLYIAYNYHSLCVIEAPLNYPQAAGFKPIVS